MRIAVLYSKPADRFKSDPAHIAAEDDTESSAIEVFDALKSKGADARLVPVTEQTIESAVRATDGDLVFNLIEWTGVDTPLAMHVFDAMMRRGTKFTGATKDNYFETCDKTLTKRMLAEAGLPTAQWQTFVTGDEPVRDDLVYPMLVKVSLEHSSVGIRMESVVSNADELKRIVEKRIREYRQPVYAESFLTGREFQVTLIEETDGLTILPPAEIAFVTDTDVPLLTYESRWDVTHTDYSNSIVKIADLEPAYARHLNDMCRKAFTGLGFRDYARFDLRCDRTGSPFFLELNSNPGLGDDDEYGMTLSYKAAGMTFADFIWKIVEAAMRRYS